MKMVSNFQREALAGRRRTLARLARDYRPAALRLGQAYRGALDPINALLVQLVESKTFYTLDTSSVALGTLVQNIAGELQPLQAAIHTEAAALTASGATVGYETGLLAMQRGGMSVRWAQPALEQVVSAINIVDRPAFRTRFGAFSQFHGEQIGDLIITAVARGRNPQETAAIIRHWLETTQRPLIDALTITRTTQVYAQREGTNAIYRRNGVEQWVWIADLGSERTCMSCIAMHGTVHPTSEYLNDHHRGRCTSVPVTPTWEELGFSDGGDVPIETGVDWFARQPDDVQARIMGPQLFSQYQQGAFQFDPAVVVGTYHNDIFGDMRRVRTNKEILSTVAR